MWSLYGSTASASSSWHFLVCTGLSNDELSCRHDAVCESDRSRGPDGRGSGERGGDGIARQERIAIRPATMCTRRATGASLTVVSWQGAKSKKYAAVASRIGAELFNMSLDTSGGMASDAARLVKAIVEEGERWSAGTWTSSAIERQLLDAIQRGNALAMLTGYTRATAAVALGRRDSRLGARDGDKAENASGAV